MTEHTPEAQAAKIARDAEERGEGICRTCLAPIWNEGGTVGHQKRDTGWSDRIERGGDSLVCFKAIEYRHVPLETREAAIYDVALARGRSSMVETVTSEALEALRLRHTRQGRPKLANCSCGAIICPDLAILESLFRPDREEGKG